MIEFREALGMAHDLIQEAKGADGPKGGFVTDALDDAENWLDHAATAHDRRVTELLEANNREVENRRMLTAVLLVGQKFLDACNSAWAAGEPSHRVVTMLNAADEFRSALKALERIAR